MKEGEIWGVRGSHCRSSSQEADSAEMCVQEVCWPVVAGSAPGVEVKEVRWSRGSC